MEPDITGQPEGAGRQQLGEAGGISAVPLPAETPTARMHAYDRMRRWFAETDPRVIRLFWALGGGDLSDLPRLRVVRPG